MPHKPPSQPGDVFGRLTLVERRGRHPDNGNAIWFCACECGGSVVCDIQRLRTGNTKSCGCLRRENSAVMCAALSASHGRSYSGEYRSYWAMRRRCKAGSPGAKYYHDRGVRVCDRWMEGFENFYADMGPRPGPGHSIERIDVDGNYEPGNCRWATAKEQAGNRRGHTATYTADAPMFGNPKNVGRYRKAGTQPA